MSFRTLKNANAILLTATVWGILIYLNEREVKIEKIKEEPILIKEKPAIVKKTIADLLKEEDDVFLLEENEKVGNPWKTSWDYFNYRYEKEDLSENWGALNYNEKRSEEAPKAFKNLCKKNSETKVENKDSKIYKEVKEYCTKPKK